MPKTIGIIGGMSPESTVEYYRYIVHEYTRRFDDHNYPPIIIYSVSFEPYIRWPAEGRWDLVAEGLSAAARRLEAAGADCILIATNTMHIVFNEVQSAVNIPMINLLDAVAQEILRRGINKAGLLGTKYTMDMENLYPESLRAKGIEVITPGNEDKETVNRVIYEELIKGIIRKESKLNFRQIIEEMASRGAEGVILGCTEIPLLVSSEDTELQLFDTTIIHAQAALEFALS